MTDNYLKIVRDKLKSLYSNLPPTLETDLPGSKAGNHFEFDAFGRRCQIRPDGIALDGEGPNSVLGILISLYALHANSNPLVLEPLKAFKDFPNSMPYAGAFTTHTQNILVPCVGKIKERSETIINSLNGRDVSSIFGGDFSFLLNPLPKIALCYIFYEADDDFPASVTCLYSNNAVLFLPIDGLADVGEYTSRQISNFLDTNARA